MCKKFPSIAGWEGGEGGEDNGMSHCIVTTTYLLPQFGNQHSGKTGKRYLVQMTSYCLVGIERCRFFSANITKLDFKITD